MGSFSRDYGICSAWFKQLNRNIGNPNFRPRWKRCSSQSTGKCSIQGCKHNMHKSTCIATEAEIEQVIGKPIVAFNVEEDGSSINLCQAHYNYLYSQLTLSTAIHRSSQTSLEQTPVGDGDVESGYPE